MNKWPFSGLRRTSFSQAFEICIKNDSCTLFICLFWQKEKCDTKILFCYRLFQTQHFLLRCQKDSCKQSPFRLKSYNKVKIISMIVFHTFFFCEMTFLAHPNLVACIYLMNRKDIRKILLSTGNRIEMHWKNNQNLE